MLTNVINITVKPPGDFSVLKNVRKNRFLKIAHRTGCETGVCISFPKKRGL